MRNKRNFVSAHVEETTHREPENQTVRKQMDTHKKSPVNCVETLSKYCGCNALAPLTVMKNRKNKTHDLGFKLRNPLEL